MVYINSPYMMCLQNARLGSVTVNLHSASIFYFYFSDSLKNRQKLMGQYDFIANIRIFNSVPDSRNVALYVLSTLMRTLTSAIKR